MFTQPWSWGPRPCLSFCYDFLRQSFDGSSFLFFFLLCRAVPVAHGGTQARVKLQLPANATATAIGDPSRICDLHHSSEQRGSLTH